MSDDILEVNGWTIYAHPLFLDQLDAMIETVDKAPGISPEMIRGYGGAQVDRYDAHFPPEKFESAARTMALLSDALKGEILKKSSER